MKIIKVLLILIIISLFYQSFYKESAVLQTSQQVAAKNIIASYQIASVNKKTYTVFIDDTFTTLQEAMIYNAANSWGNASSKKIQIITYFKIQKYGKIENFIYKKYKDKSIYMWNIEPDDLNNDLTLRFNLFAGLWDTTGNILIFNQKTGDRFYNVALHELGHMLGLPHYDYNYSTVMRYMYASNCITEIDAEELCKIHNCKPMPECSAKYYNF